MSSVESNAVFESPRGIKSMLKRFWRASPSTVRQNCLSFLFFSTGLILLDQGVLVTGRWLVKSQYWPDPIWRTLVLNSAPAVLGAGGCRTALHFDPDIVSQDTGQKYFNAGRIVDGIGGIDFTLALAFQVPSIKYVVIQIDDGNWEETIETAKEDLRRREVWWYLLSKENRDYFRTEYGMQPDLVPSGFWQFRHLGEALARSILRAGFNKPVAELDGYIPRSASQNIIPTLNDPSVTDGIRRTLGPSAFAVGKVKSFVQRSLQHGIKPILVTSPMHRLRATDAVNRRQAALLSSIARKYGVPFKDYLDNSGELARADPWWSDQGHLNKAGATNFSKRFAADLKTLF